MSFLYAENKFPDSNLDSNEMSWEGSEEVLLVYCLELSFPINVLRSHM